MKGTDMVHAMASQLDMYFKLDMCTIIKQATGNGINTLTGWLKRL